MWKYVHTNRFDWLINNKSRWFFSVSENRCLHFRGRLIKMHFMKVTQKGKKYMFPLYTCCNLFKRPDKNNIWEKKNCRSLRFIMSKLLRFIGVKKQDGDPYKTVCCKYVHMITIVFDQLWVVYIIEQRQFVFVIAPNSI